LFASADTVVVEQKLVGPELSLIALCDGDSAALFSLSRDYKRVGTGDVGGNTGGMGAFCPLPRRDAEELAAKAISPILQACKNRGTPYRGFLYAGIMFDGLTPYVLEYNVRLGDPEAQALLVAQQDDIMPALFGAAAGRIHDFPAPCGAAVCLVLAARGYPSAPELGARIVGIGPAKKHPGVHVFGAGVRKEGGGLVVAGGRVLSIVGHAGTVAEARRRAYAAADAIHFDAHRAEVFGTLIRREDIALGVGLERQQ
jgi:phosphoribosylamine--glycine ligase